MSTEVNYFGDFTSSIIISEDRLKYLEDAGVEIISCELYEAKPQLKDTRAFLIYFKVSNMTFLQFYQAGIKYSMDKYYKP
jgi:hypothetical protein